MWDIGQSQRRGDAHGSVDERHDREGAAHRDVRPWSGGNMDEGWTRWVLDGTGSNPRGSTMPRSGPAVFVRSSMRSSCRTKACGRCSTETRRDAARPEYRGGIGEEGVSALQAFVNEGGTLITLGAASDLAIERFPVPVRNLKAGLTRDQHFAPGKILRIEVDAHHPVGYGMPSETYRLYNDSPSSRSSKGSRHSVRQSLRVPNTGVVASGWLRGEDLMAGRAAVVSIDMNPGRVVLFGLRPQHRAQTHATFPLLFNALYLSTVTRASS